MTVIKPGYRPDLHRNWSTIVRRSLFGTSRSQAVRQQPDVHSFSPSARITPTRSLSTEPTHAVQAQTSHRQRASVDFCSSKIQLIHYVPFTDTRVQPDAIFVLGLLAVRITTGRIHSELQAEHE